MSNLVDRVVGLLEHAEVTAAEWARLHHALWVVDVTDAHSDDVMTVTYQR